jgi:pimeloyl-ACP methyl ester carboxylesterase
LCDDSLSSGRRFTSAFAASSCFVRLMPMDMVRFFLAFLARHDSHDRRPGGKFPGTDEGTRMTDITHASFTLHDFRTAGGEILPEATLAYVSRGKLAADGRNAILITHGYTSGPRMIEPGVASSEGAWTTLVGPGAPIDTDRYFVICSNMLGSSYGSTNAASIDPRTGKPYGSKFPLITMEDIVTAQMRMLEGLGVTHLRAVVGPSYGGFQAFQWGVTFPDFMDGIVPVVTSPLARTRTGSRFAEMVRTGSELEWRRLLRDRRSEADADRAADRYAHALWHGELSCRPFSRQSCRRRRTPSDRRRLG